MAPSKLIWTQSGNIFGSYGDGYEDIASCNLMMKTESSYETSISNSVRLEVNVPSLSECCGASSMDGKIY